MAESESKELVVSVEHNATTLADVLSERKSLADLIDTAEAVYKQTISDKDLIGAEMLLLDRAKELGCKTQFSTYLKAIKKERAENNKIADNATTDTDAKWFELDQNILPYDNEEIARDDHGKPKSTIKNFHLILKYDSRFNGYQFNEVSYRREVFRGGDNPKIEQWDESHDAETLEYIESEYGVYDEKKIRKALTKFFIERHYNPIVKIFEKLPEWDGIPRMEGILTKYFAADPTEINKFISRYIFDAAYKRAVDRGCKMDAVPILIGKQGCGKSEFVRQLALFPDEYAGKLPHDENRNTKVVHENNMRGKWIIEIPELSSFSHEYLDYIKDFLTSRCDEYRPTWGEYLTTFPRQCIFIATTNNPTVLNDPTGNRRWLPVTLNTDATGGKVLMDNIKELQSDIINCYSEAKYRYENGQAEYVVPDALWDDIEKQREEASAYDPIAEDVKNYVGEMKSGEWTYSDIILYKVFGLSPSAIRERGREVTIKAKAVNRILRSMDCLKYDANRRETFTPEHIPFDDNPVVFRNRVYIKR